VHSNGGARQTDEEVATSGGNGGGGEARYAFMSISNEVGLATAPQGWARVDLWHGRETPAQSAGSRHEAAAPYAAHYLTTRQFSEEVVLVPKAPRHALNSEAGQATSTLHASARVWVLGMFFDAPSGRSALAVVDGETMQRQATVWLEHASPHGLHGSWQTPPER
jgi:carotenoid cleavage dioxygenase-like enzyme